MYSFTERFCLHRKYVWCLNETITIEFAILNATNWATFHSHRPAPLSMISICYPFYSYPAELKNNYQAQIGYDTVKVVVRDVYRILFHLSGVLHTYFLSWYHFLLIRWIILFFYIRMSQSTTNQIYSEKRISPIMVEKRCNFTWLMGRGRQLQMNQFH